MGAVNRAKDAAKRYLSPDTQQVLKQAYLRGTGPRRPSRLMPAPQDPEGAARHAVLIAHASGRPADHARARQAWGRWALADRHWRVAARRRSAGQPADPAPTPAVDVVVVAALSAAPRDQSTHITLGLPGSAGCAHILLADAAHLLDNLGDDEQAAVFTAVARGIVAGRAVRSAIAIPADHPVAAAIARSLIPRVAEQAR